MPDGSYRAGASVAHLHDRLVHNLVYIRGVEPGSATTADLVAALELAVRERLIDRFTTTRRAWQERQAKTVCYLSMEFLVGPLLRNNLLATRLWDPARQALAELGYRLDDVLDAEPDPGLGNGGLGRLAACFLDSLATLRYPAYGYGLRYDYGIFRQEILGGWQRERPDRWLEGGYAWEIARPELRLEVPLGGTVEWSPGGDRRQRPVWHPNHRLIGIPHDVLVAGHGTDSVAVLRLWKAEAPDEFDFETFSHGDFLRAVASRENAEAVTKVLYPSDAVEAGRRLRLMQEYFLVACTVRDVVRRFRTDPACDWSLLPRRVALQLNDTHPALAAAELMRVLIDEGALAWQPAWEITRECCGYTNHTLRPEALESWPISLVQQLLPRHVQIIYDINQRLLEEVGRHHPGDLDRMRRVSLVDENGEKRFRMAHLAVVASHRVNGVSHLHTELLKRHVFPDFVELWPERFVSITNGITPRRWLAACNPRLAALITERIGDAWQHDLGRLAALAAVADDPDFQDAFLAAKRANKAALAPLLATSCGARPDPDSLFDVQVKRMHEYKRQLLLALHVITLYRRIKADPGREITPRTVIVGGKAAPAYYMAKLVIRLINGIAAVVNPDPDVAGRLRVAFVPDYRVSLAEAIIPAADLSEQISTAGTEASGTGNMKLALNGALTIGTLDGANIEIRDAVGHENFFAFGATPAVADSLLTPGGHDPRRTLAEDEELAAVLEDLRRGTFAGSDQRLLLDLWTALVDDGDRFLTLADYRSYVETQGRVAEAFRDRRRWAAMAIRNVAAMGYFSADRAVEEYAREVWDLSPLPAAAHEAARTAEGRH
jgi:starch phosphorylase